MPSSFGDRIRALRKARDLTQQELADKAKIKQPSLSDIESGETSVHDVKAITLLALADALEVDPRALAGKRSVDSLANQLLWLYDRLSPETKDTLLGNAQRLFSQEHPEASIGNPFAGDRPPIPQPRRPAPKRPS